MQRFCLDPTRLQHKVVHEDDRAEGDKNIFAEEQPDVIGRRRHRAQAVAYIARQRAKALFRRPLRHRRQQRAHHLRMSAEAGQPQSGGGFAHKQIDDQQTSGGRAMDLRDPRLRPLFQTMALQQPDHRQRQQQNKRQITGIQEALAQFLQNSGYWHMRRHAGDDPGDNHHQHRVKA